MNALFICTYNQWRSLTAEKLFANCDGITVKSAGIASTARIRISEKLLTWADLIFVMEPRHQEYIIELFPAIVEKKEIICLDISSEYQFNDPELIQLLKEGTKKYF